ncbi:MAG: hypothetical protein FJ313_04950, partial [Gemmatimonadetes bacterium]|nr:hypothetical protein [Gemmatimonadota bacterium]
AGAREDEGEARLARLVAGRFETDHTDLHVGYGDRTLLPRMAWHFGEPFADISALAVHQISKAAREHITVALTGDGGDESFCGYANVRAALVAERMRRLLPGPVRTAMHTLLGQGAVRRRLPAAARFDRWLTRYVARPASGQYDLINHWDAALRQSLYVARALPEAGAASVVESVQQGAGSLSDAELHLYTDVRLRLPADYLTKVDIASNMASLEVRSPFLDHEVMELAASLPLSVRMRGWRQKALLRALVKRRLPPELASAPKRGFGPPLGRWLRREWADLVDGLVDRRLAARDGLFDGEVIRRCVAEHRAGIADHTQRLWTLAALELWLELFVDRSLSPGDAV